jgi:hypothetical protein
MTEITSDVANLKTIREAELDDFLINNAVKRLGIIENKQGTYHINVVLNWKGGDHYLVTTRGGLRNWVSLDRLIRHINSKPVEYLPPIHLVLLKNSKKLE